MLISIVNHSVSISDGKLQAVIRAINRQLREDFKPHWGRGAQLRLEGRSARSPVPDTASDIRGTAVVYLCDCADDAETAIGYHELNQRGIPYGFVFTDLAKALKEPWSITLSHEVLELVLDPEVNLVAKGPHPEDPTREVFHWYEACDAVQTQWYEIDGVRVSNFVLPLYFTADPEPGGRNDFLGVRKRNVPPLPSFGVAPGGYIGFFDPDIADDRYYEPSALARRRNAIKRRAGLARRSIRYQRNAAPLGQLDDLVGAGALPPRLESIALRMKPRQANERSVRSLVGRVLGSGWRIAPNPAMPGEFDLLPGRRSVDAGRAWELAYQLRNEDGVVRAEPLFEAQLPDDEARQELIAARLGKLMRASKQGIARTAPSDPEWSALLVRADRAWGLLDKRGIGYGAGVRIGHPDTGFTDHDELPQARINKSLDYDFVDDDDVAVDTLEEGLLLNPGHGTGTSSVILCPRMPRRTANELHVTGIAPAAELVPLRVARSVVQVSQKNLRDAIHRAVDNGCHVISISLGGLPSGTLHDAIQRAVAEGVIVLAAAGNDVRIVVWPARYEEVVAVAACNERGEPWSGSSRGSAVDVTGPGESVYRAYWEKSDNGDRSSEVGPSNGTSYAVATVAGIAALWLAYRASELAKIPKAEIPGLFARLLAKSCRPDISVPDGFGSGVVDAERLLDAPLTSAGPHAAARRARIAAKDPSDPLDRLASLFPRMDAAAARDGLLDLLGRPSRTALAHLHDELRFWLTLDPKLHAAVGAHLGMSEADPGKTRPRARRAQMLRARAAITAIGASRDLRESLWSDR